MDKYYIVAKEVLPDKFEKVLEAKRMLRSGEAKNISEASKALGISRGTYYKYKDSIYNFNEDVSNRKAVISMSITGGCGSLSKVINLLSKYKVNILSIDQSIPINGIHNLSFILDLSNVEISIEKLIPKIEELEMISNAMLVAIE